MKAFWFNSFTRLEVITNQTGVLFFGTPGSWCDNIISYFFTTVISEQ